MSIYYHQCDDYNGDRMIVKMILIAVMVRPMSRTLGSDDHNGDSVTFPNQGKVFCLSTRKLLATELS